MRFMMGVFADEIGFGVPPPKGTHIGLVRKLLISLPFLIAPPQALAQLCPSAPYQVCVITSGTNRTTSSTYSFVTYAWDSSTAAPKTLTVGSNCTTNGFEFGLKDEIGTTAAFLITAQPQSGNAIDGAQQVALNSNYESITFQCDGLGNWLVE